MRIMEPCVKNVTSLLPEKQVASWPSAPASAGRFSVVPVPARTPVRLCAVIRGVQVAFNLI